MKRRNAIININGCDVVIRHVPSSWTEDDVICMHVAPGSQHDGVSVSFIESENHLASSAEIVAAFNHINDEVATMLVDTHLVDLLDSNARSMFEAGQLGGIEALSTLANLVDRALTSMIRASRVKTEE